MILSVLRGSRHVATSTRGDPTPGASATAARPPGPAPTVPGHDRLLRVVVSVAIVGGPLAYLVGGVLSPAVHTSGRATIADNVTANPVTDTAHLVAFVVASFLLPVGAVGLAWLARRRTPWLATIGGLLAVVGWLPFSALAALDDLASAMAQLPGSGSYATLLDRFTNDPVMSTYLVVYIVGHLVAYVLLGIALRRARVVPRWAAWALIASSPVMVAGFVLPGRVADAGLALGAASVALLLIGSLPAARALAAGASPGIGGSGR